MLNMIPRSSKKVCYLFNFLILNTIRISLPHCFANIVCFQVTCLSKTQIIHAIFLVTMCITSNQEIRPIILLSIPGFLMFIITLKLLNGLATLTTCFILNSGFFLKFLYESKNKDWLLHQYTFL
jgi:hypothetical protein